MTPETLPSLFLRSLSGERSEPLCQGTGTDGRPLPATALRERVGLWTAELDKLGVGAGTRVALMSSAGPDPLALQLSLWIAGAIVVLLPTDLSGGELAACLEIAETDVLAADPRALPSPAPTVRRSISLRADSLGSEAGPVATGELEERAQSRRPDDPALLRLDLGADGIGHAAAETCRTTLLEHRHLASAVRGLGSRIDLPAGTTVYSNLPLDNALRTTLDLLCLERRLPNVYAPTELSGRPRADASAQAMARFRPGLVAGDFGFYKDLLGWIYRHVQGSDSKLRQRTFHWAVAMGKQNQAARRGGRPESHLGGLIASRVFKPYRQRLGGRVQLALADRPLASGWVEFLLSVGIPVLETYCSWLAAAPLTAARKGEIEPGSAGHAIPGVEVRIADVAIEACGATLASAEPSLLGDAGQLTGEGVLAILGPLGSALKTRNGQVYPAPIERVLEGSHFTDRAMVIEDGDGGLAALLTPDLGAIEEWAARQDITESDPEILLKHERVHRLFISEVISINRILEPDQQIRSWRLLAEGFSRENGELAPNRELVRRAIVKNRSQQIDALRAG